MTFGYFIFVDPTSRRVWIEVRVVGVDAVGPLLDERVRLDDIGVVVADVKLHQLGSGVSRRRRTLLDRSPLGPEGASFFRLTSNSLRKSGECSTP